MLEGLFSSIFGTTVSIPSFLIASAVALVLGAAIAFSHSRTAGASASMRSTLALMPFLVEVVILLVNGNLGAGVAVAGAFSLVRFRSAPGTARDITAIFLTMTVGLACGMGYVALAAFAAVLVCGLCLLTARFQGLDADERTLKITIPEDLDYNGVFDEPFTQYTHHAHLEKVRTTNMGSLYQLCYRICLKSAQEEKAFLDALRCRNGNLEIVCARVPEGRDAL